MNSELDGIYISKGYKPFWKLLFPYACFVLALYCTYKASLAFATTEFEYPILILIVSFIVILPLVVLGIYFARITDYHFDFDRKKYKIVKRVGPFRRGSWRSFENLGYVSLFSNLDNNYQLNLWYNTNRHFTIDTFWNYETALEIGKEISEQLDIGFHDAAEEGKHNGVIEKERLVRDEDRQVDVHITQGTRPIWKTLVASALFIVAMIGIVNVVSGFDIDFGNKRLTFNFFTLEFSVLALFIGFGLAVVQDYQFDFKNDQFKHIYRVGPIKFGYWEVLEQLEYVSVFQEKPGTFKVNLWYNTNKRVNFASYDNLDLAMKVGKVLAKKLFINVLDASDPHNTKWIEL